MFSEMSILKNKIIFIFIILVVILVVGGFYFWENKWSNNKSLTCDLNNPIKIFDLPNELKEVSGITYFADKKMACVQDELGTIYIYDLEKNKISELTHFQESGDYEGIAYHDDIFYLLRSDGLLVKVDTLKNSVEKFILETGAKNNEGLTYDKFTGKLLITTKSKVGDGKELKDKRLVYLFNLESKKLEDEPLFIIELEKIEDYAKTNNLTLEKIKFRPSEIAVHPSDSSIYVMSAIDNLLIRFDRQGNILNLFMLDKNIYQKPEGITIDNLGNIFISSEGSDSSATLLQSCLNK